MSKYKSREAPIPGSSLSETHPGYWADHINLENSIRLRWYKDYGHKYFDKNYDPRQCPMHRDKTAEHRLPPDRQVPCSKPEPVLKSILKKSRTPEGGYPDITYGYGGTANELAPDRYTNYEAHEPTDGRYGVMPTSGYSLNEPRKDSGYRHTGMEEPKMRYVYPTPGNVTQHNPVEDPVTSYSSSFGHHSYQAGLHSAVNQGEVNAYRPADGASCIRYGRYPPPEYGKGNVYRTSSDPDLASYTSRGDNRSLLAQRNDPCSLGELSKSKSNSFSDLPFETERCPKCCRMSCCCVPRRRQKVPEFKESGPETELPSWPPQIWHGPTYNGYRRKTEGDILQLRHRLFRDPELRTAMNRMYEEMQQVNYYDGKCRHSGTNSFQCPICQLDCTAERGSWLDEQLRKGNPFTTGDTHFKACAYATKI